MRKMYLWFPIMKENETIMWIHVCLNWQTYINSKNVRKRCFSYKTKASISFIPMRRMCLRCPVLKIKKITIWIRVCLNQHTYINTKNGRKICFSYETSINITYANKETMFTMPNLEKNGDYYVNPYLSKSEDEL